MKKSLAAAFLAIGLLSFPVVADDTNDVYGTVTKIDHEAKTFEIKSNSNQVFKFTVNQTTDFDIENQNNQNNRISNLLDMREGDTVKVDYYFSNPANLLADEVDIYR